MEIPTTQCIKISFLRKTFPKEGIDLEKWMDKTNSLYVGRNGRIFITEDGGKRIFHYKGSIWGNPYKVGTKEGEYTLTESLRLYKKHVEESDLYDHLEELSGKTLGCFCDQKHPCHAQVLVELFKEKIAKKPKKVVKKEPKKMVKVVKKAAKEKVVKKKPTKVVTAAKEKVVKKEPAKAIKKAVKKKVVKKEPVKEKVVKKEPVKEKVVKKEPKEKVVKKAAKEKKIVKKVKEMPKIIIAQHGRGVSYPQKEGFKVYPIHSKGAKPWKELSPFFIGPIEYINEKGEKCSCLRFEHWWQSSKVYKKVNKQKQKSSGWEWPAETHLGEDGDPNKKWYKWRDSLCKYEKAVRRPNGKAVPEYSWWLNPKTKKYEKLGLVEARKKIYIPLLKELYRKHPVYQKLLQDFKNGQNIILVEPDGPWRELYPEGREVTLDLLKNLIEKTNYGEEGNPTKYFPYGHGYVAAMCLLEDYKK